MTLGVRQEGHPQGTGRLGPLEDQVRENTSWALGEAGAHRREWGTNKPKFGRQDRSDRSGPGAGELGPYAGVLLRARSSHLPGPDAGPPSFPALSPQSRHRKVPFSHFPSTVHLNGPSYRETRSLANVKLVPFILKQSKLGELKRENLEVPSHRFCSDVNEAKEGSLAAPFPC